MTVLHPTGRMWNASGPAREPSSSSLLMQSEAREHKLETCRRDLDLCHWLEAEKNGPLRKDREKGETPATEVRVGVVSLAGRGRRQELFGVLGREGITSEKCQSQETFLDSCHPSLLPYSAGR